MQDAFNKYGRKLTEQEFVQASADNYPDPDMPFSRQQDAQYRKEETSLMIDYLLGVDYPQDKREALHAARERATKRFTRNPVTLIKCLFEAATRHTRADKRVPDFDEGSLDFAARVTAEEFSKETALDTQDIIAFIGPEAAPYVHKLRGTKPQGPKV